ncbi:hypothetical protein JMA_28990 [Jeotgalibacillus malaysiensis]|uniref:HNH nuclease domain-containing protein n=1 Tax=Jeotgalibacillus malaysiensis TaxID=1508404 RepID=A0A0B5AQ34_9BACL|nr:HNH endonuclease [Jeotgalibacillus malaysiensis]AJD92216.1 hypothetical protein JMA_28990 [Jeotgalibacillus malaysiensis]
MQLVNHFSDVLQNIHTLNKYRDEEVYQNTYRGYIARGSCFLIYKKNGEMYIGPSRFIGYLDNSIEKHESAYEIDGRVTNKKITKILNQPCLVNEEAEKLFQEYCNRHGISPHIKVRKYWVISDSNAEIVEDILEVTATEERGTDRLTLINARLGQGKFRENLMDLWNCHCPISGISHTNLLVASHIKPWNVSNHKERLDLYNGLLLSAHYDKLFDSGYISFHDDGGIIISSHLDEEEFSKLQLNNEIKIELHNRHKSYMSYHREHVLDKWKKNE